MMRSLLIQLMKQRRDESDTEKERRGLLISTVTASIRMKKMRTFQIKWTKVQILIMMNWTDSKERWLKFRRKESLKRRWEKAKEKPDKKKPYLMILMMHNHPTAEQRTMLTHKNTLSCNQMSERKRTQFWKILNNSFKRTKNHSRIERHLFKQFRREYLSIQKHWKSNSVTTLMKRSQLKISLINTSYQTWLNRRTMLLEAKHPCRCRSTSPKIN